MIFYHKQHISNFSGLMFCEGPGRSFDVDLKLKISIQIRKDRNRKGGCVMCYIKDDLNFNHKENISDEIEHIFLDLLLPNTAPILIGNNIQTSRPIRVYRKAVTSSRENLYSFGNFRTLYNTWKSLPGVGV